MQAQNRCQPDGRSIEVEHGTPDLEAARRAGLPMASACGAQAICGRCGVYVVGDALRPEDPLERDVKARNRVDSRQRLACCIPVAGDLEVRASYW